MKHIIDYLTKKYAPHTMIVYGSYADGTSGPDSDFDALVVEDGLPISHDTGIVGGIRMDVFVYPTDFFAGAYDIRDFEQLHDGKAVIDDRGLGGRLIGEAAAYVADYVPKDREEIHDALSWCEKMLLRTGRGDAEGYFRWHWLLTDSLEICFDLLGQRYLGPKKALRRLAELDPEGFALYSAALTDFTQASLRAWIEHLIRRFRETETL